MPASADGAAILGIDHPGIAELAPRITARQIRFGFSADADVRAESIDVIPGGQRCHVRLAGGDRFSFDLPMPGRHNVLNALAAIAVESRPRIVSILCLEMASVLGIGLLVSAGLTWCTSQIGPNAIQYFLRQ